MGILLQYNNKSCKVLMHEKKREFTTVQKQFPRNRETIITLKYSARFY